MNSVSIPSTSGKGVDVLVVEDSRIQAKFWSDDSLPLGIPFVLLNMESGALRWCGSEYQQSLFRTSKCPR